MIMECTDCQHVLNFSDGYRVICIHPNLAPDRVVEFYPIGDQNAENCEGFEEGYEFAQDMTSDDLTKAEASFGDDEDWYKGIRAWFERES
jgi:hypothetical protein